MDGEQVGGTVLGIAMFVVGSLLLRYRHRTYPFLYGWFGRRTSDIPRQFLISFYGVTGFLIIGGAYIFVQSVRGWP